MLAVTFGGVASTVWRRALGGLKGPEEAKNHREYLGKYG
jgi:hypothetical protein